MSESDRARGTKRVFDVIRPHEPDPGSPLSLHIGDRVRFERRPTHWEGWLFCTTATLSTGWVPESWVRIDDVDSCTLLRDYDATELPGREGDRLEEILIESGWLLARAASGEEGWIPLECVKESTPPGRR